MGTPNRERQEYSRNVIEYKDPGRYIPIIFLGVPCLGFPLGSLYLLLQVQRHEWQGSAGQSEGLVVH